VIYAAFVVLVYDEKLTQESFSTLVKGVRGNFPCSVIARSILSDVAISSLKTASSEK